MTRATFVASTAGPPVVAPLFRLDPDEFPIVLHVLQDLLGVQTPENFRAWADGPLQALLPHGMMIAGMAAIEAPAVQIRKVIVENWPLSYFELLRQPDGSFQSPIMARWHERNTPQLYDPAVNDDVARGLWSDVFFDYHLGNIAAHGLRDLSGTYTTYFNFSQIPEKLSARHGYLLDLLTPHMHVALTRALMMVDVFSGGAPLVHLTGREQVILYWMREGKTNWEIAHICQRSEHTIKNQIEALFRKLQVSNRTQATTKVSAMGIRLERPDAGT
ncbi:MAG: transcriptional regulator EpsA [Candidatus Paceibacteria bacterium]|jgi:transcriptional regulator EpsA